MKDMIEIMKKKKKGNGKKIIRNTRLRIIHKIHKGVAPRVEKNKERRNSEVFFVITLKLCRNSSLSIKCLQNSAHENN